MAKAPRTESDSPVEKVLYIVIEDAYKTPTVNAQKYVHTVAADSESEACERVGKVIRERMDGEGRKLLDDGVNLTVVDWQTAVTVTARDSLELRYLGG